MPDSIRPVLGSIQAVSSLFLIEQGGYLSIVDTGIKGCLRRVVGALARSGHHPGDVRQIVLTHCHGDHSGEAKRLKELTGATLVAGAADAPVLEGSVPYPAPPGPLFRVIFHNLGRFPRVQVDRLVHEREELEGGLVAIPAPGHTAGHLAVHVPDQAALLVGDAVWHLGPLRPAWRQVTQDPARNAESVKELAAIRVDRVFPGHGPAVSRDRFVALARAL